MSIPLPRGKKMPVFNCFSPGPKDLLVILFQSIADRIPGTVHAKDIRCHYNLRICVLTIYFFILVSLWESGLRFFFFPKIGLTGGNGNNLHKKHWTLNRGRGGDPGELLDSASFEGQSQWSAVDLLRKLTVVSAHLINMVDGAEKSYMVPVLKWVTGKFNLAVQKKASSPVYTRTQISLSSDSPSFLQFLGFIHFPVFHV